MGYEVQVDASALARHQRFGGDDDTRLAALHRIAEQAPSIAMATRGGYGITRLLDRIDWPLDGAQRRARHALGRLSDVTALQLGMLAHGGAGSWAGPTAVDDFGRSDEDGGVDDVTAGCFNEAMSGVLEAVGFRTEARLRRAGRRRPAVGRQPVRADVVAGNEALAAHQGRGAVPGGHQRAALPRGAHAAATAPGRRAGRRRRRLCWATSRCAPSRRWTAASR